MTSLPRFALVASLAAAVLLWALVGSIGAPTEIPEASTSAVSAEVTTLSTAPESFVRRGPAVRRSKVLCSNIDDDQAVTVEVRSATASGERKESRTIAPRRTVEIRDLIVKGASTLTIRTLSPSGILSCAEYHRHFTTPTAVTLGGSNSNHERSISGARIAISRTLFGDQSTLSLQIQNLAPVDLTGRFLVFDNRGKELREIPVALLPAGATETISVPARERSYQFLSDQFGENSPVKLLAYAPSGGIVVPGARAISSSQGFAITPDSRLILVNSGTKASQLATQTITTSGTTIFGNIAPLSLSTGVRVVRGATLLRGEKAGVVSITSQCGETTTSCPPSFFGYVVTGGRVIPLASNSFVEGRALLFQLSADSLRGGKLTVTNPWVSLASVVVVGRGSNGRETARAFDLGATESSEISLAALGIKNQNGTILIESSAPVSAWIAGNLPQREFRGRTTILPQRLSVGAAQATPTPVIPTIAPPTVAIGTATPTRTPVPGAPTATPTRTPTRTPTPVPPTATPTRTPTSTPTPVPPTATPTRTPTPVVSATCRNNILEAPVEQCDDGNNTLGDGCDAQCKIEVGWVCTTINSRSVCDRQGTEQFSPFRSEKIQLPSLAETPISAPLTAAGALPDGVSASGAASGATIAADQQITIVVDEGCRRKRQQSNAAPLFLDSRLPAITTNANDRFQDAAYSITLGVATTTAQLQTYVDEHPCVVGISESLVTVPASFNDPLAAQQSYLNAIKFSESYSAFTSSAGNTKVNLAIIDTGFDFANIDKGEIHPILDGTNMSWRPGDAGSVDLPQDLDGHGTAVTNIITARTNNNVGMVGIAGNNTVLIPVRVAGDERSLGEVSSVTLFRAIQRAVNIGADIVSISRAGVGQICDPVVGHAIYRAIQKGTFFVFAAGNGIFYDENDVLVPGELYSPRDDGPDRFKPTAFPGCWGRYFKGAITVAALETGTNTLSPYSNYGESVELAAPGTGILSFDLNNVSKLHSGTSFSAPQVAGAAALTIATFKNRGWYYSPWIIEDAILLGSRQLTALQTKFNGGRVLDMKALSDFMGVLATYDDAQRRAITTGDQREGDGWKGDERQERIERIFITAPVMGLSLNQQTQLKAVALYKDGTFQDISAETFFSSSDGVNMPVTHFGGNLRFTSLPSDENPQPVRIIGHFQGFKDSLEVRFVTAADQRTLTAIAVLPPTEIRPHATASFAVEATYTENKNGQTVTTKEIVSRAATWTTSNNTAVRSIGIPGVFSLESAQAGQSYTVNATFGGRSASHTFTLGEVGGETFLIESPLGRSAFKGQSITLRSVLLLDSGLVSRPFVSTWSSLTPGLTLSGSSSERTINTTNLAPGDYRVRATATYRGTIPAKTLQAEFSFSVTEQYSRLQLLTRTPVIKFTERAQLTARAYFDNNSYQVLPAADVTWSSADTSKVTVDARGIAYPRAGFVGSVNLTASFRGLSDTIELHVIPYDIVDGTDAELVMLEVGLSPGSMPIRFHLWGAQLFARAFYSDGTFRDVTRVSSWSSSSPIFVIGGDGYASVRSQVAFGGAVGSLTALYSGKRGEIALSIPEEEYLSSYLVFHPSPVTQGQVGLIAHIITALRDNSQIVQYDSYPGTYSAPPGVLINLINSDIAGVSTDAPLGTHRVVKRFDFRGRQIASPFEVSGDVTVIPSPITGIELSRPSGREISESPRVYLLEDLLIFSVSEVRENGVRVLIRDSSRLSCSISETSLDSPATFAGCTIDELGRVVVRRWSDAAVGEIVELRITDSGSGFSATVPISFGGAISPSQAPQNTSAVTGVPPEPVADDPFCTPERRALSPFAGEITSQSLPRRTVFICSERQFLNLGTPSATTVEGVRLLSSLDFESYPNLRPIQLSSGIKFEGLGREIRNYTVIDSELGEVGIFGFLRINGGFSDLIVRNPRMIGASSVGGLAGTISITTGSLSRITVIGGTIQGEGNVGGISGHAMLGGFFDSNRGGANELRVLDTRVSPVGGLGGSGLYHGGFFGWGTGAIRGGFSSAIIESIGAPGTVSRVGGAIGAGNSSTILLDRVVFSGSITLTQTQGLSRVGGLVGESSAGAVVHRSENRGELVATGSDVGGLIGFWSCQRYDRNCSISHSSSSGRIWGGANSQGASNVGGLVGYSHGGMIFDSTVTGEVKGVSDVGGLIGKSHEFHRITRVTVNALVSGSGQGVGGVIGGLYRNIINYTNNGQPVVFDVNNLYSSNRWHRVTSPGVTHPVGRAFKGTQLTVVNGSMANLTIVD